MAVLAWMVFLTVVSFVFWRTMQSLVGLNRALDPDLPVFESARGNLATFLTPTERSLESNPDGSQRQELLKACHIGDRVELRGHSKRRDGETVVHVHRRDGPQIGSLGARAARDVGESLRNGLRVEALIADIHKGTRFPGTREAILKITRERPAR